MTKFQFHLPEEAMRQLSDLARSQGLSRAAVIRKAIGVLATADNRAPGAYVGITRDRESLDVVLMGALDVR